MLLLLSWVGLRLGKPIGLDSPFARALVGRKKLPAVSRRTLAGAVLAGTATGLLLLMLDRLLQPLLPPTIQPLPAGVALWKRLLAAFYGGITEELLLRLFLMTLIAWGIWRTAYKAQLPPDATVFRFQYLPHRRPLGYETNQAHPLHFPTACQRRYK